jgi:hypothetical protein
MIRLFCLCCLFVGIIFGGCTIDKPTVVEDTDVPYFPNSVGTKWVYAVYDSLRETSDTITITITDTVTMPQTGELASIWLFDPRPRYEDRYYGHREDSLFVVRSTIPPSLGGGDTIKVYRWRASQVPAWIYLMPMSVGEFWSCPFYDLLPDSSHVEELTTIATPSGTYNDVYRVYRLYNCGDECGGHYTYWFKPGTGIVMSNRMTLEWDLWEGTMKPQIIASWVLLEYTPAP